MGEALASVMQSLSCRDMARYVCNSASASSRCCTKDEGCECEVETREVTVLSDSDSDDNISVQCCNCLYNAAEYDIE